MGGGGAAGHLPVPHRAGGRCAVGVVEAAVAGRHEHVAVVSNPVEDRLPHVADDRKQESLEGDHRSLSEAQKADMAPPPD